MLLASYPELELKFLYFQKDLGLFTSPFFILPAFCPQPPPKGHTQQSYMLRSFTCLFEDTLLYRLPTKHFFSGGFSGNS